MPFTTLGLPASLLRGVRAMGYETPTPIQQKAIPLILEGHDLIGAAQTGSGKTAAFVLPILANMIEGRSALRALVLVPTRELAAQVETAARDYARFTRLKCGVVYGGVRIEPQERQLRGEGVDLLVATPGRLLDLHGRQSVAFEDIEVLVLDEADRMVDMGFAPDLRRILRLLPKKRQTMMFSATMPPDLNKVASEAMTDPVRLDLAPPSKPAAGITQAIYPVARHLKTDLLHAVAALHGNRTQSQRERALRDLKRGRVQILVATDIASRGIDARDVTHVINYDVPHTPEDYVHRIGRTGRAESTGDAFTLMSPEERRDVEAIERFLGKTIVRVQIPDFDYGRKQSATPHESHDRDRDRDRGRGKSGTSSRRDAPASASRPSTPREETVQHGRRPAKAADRRSRRRM